jgi:hypothetical protein
VRPSIEPHVRQYIVEEIAYAGELLGGGIVPECSFVCAWDPVRKQIVDARLVACGRRDHTPILSSDLRPGELLVHNHPSGKLEPSEQDLKIANGNAADGGFGFAIISNDATRLYVVREPVRSKPRLRAWIFWRFALLYERRP